MTYPRKITPLPEKAEDRLALCKVLLAVLDRPDVVGRTVQWGGHTFTRAGLNADIAVLELEVEK